MCSGVRKSICSEQRDGERLPAEERTNLGLSVWGAGVQLLAVVALRRSGEKPLKQAWKKGRSLSALVCLCSCQPSWEAMTRMMMMMMMTLHLQTTPSHLPQLSSLWPKPLSVSTSALVCWDLSTGGNCMNAAVPLLMLSFLISSEKDHSEGINLQYAE